MKEEICKWIAKNLVNVSEQEVITVMEIPPETSYEKSSINQQKISFSYRR